MPIESTRDITRGNGGASAFAAGGGGPSLLLVSGVPVLVAPSGTMAANGAVTLGTALPIVLAGAFVYYPAGAIVAGSAAGFYYTVFSSTTVGSVKNNVYNPALNAAPVIPLAPTNFVTTGPGAFTGVITEVTCFSVSIAAGAMGLNGQLLTQTTHFYNNSAGAKQQRIRLGGTAFFSNSATTSTLYRALHTIQNMGDAARQWSHVASVITNTANATAIAQGAINTAAAATLTLTIQNAVATDWSGFAGVSVQLNT
ncbi:MAG: hypothetical protein JWR85_4233 [Marmoricola sp.]|nr:hypothetical protein [Marmoricola sp.]